MKKFLTQNSKGYWYVRRNGRYYSLKRKTPKGVMPNDAEFDARYWSIINGREAKPPKTSVRAAIESYMASAWFTEKAPRTRADYRKVLEYVREKSGDLDITRMTRKDIVAAQKANAHRARFANYIPTVLSMVFKHIMDEGWMHTNPADGIRGIKGEKKAPHIPWTKEAIKKFRAEAGPRELLTFELLIGTGQRPGDIPMMQWNDIGEDGIKVRQSKTEKKLTIPLPRRLEVLLSDVPRKGLYIISQANGNPLAYRSMAQYMRKERSRLGVEKHDLHALRYNATQELAAAGVSDEGIKSITGHSTDDMVRKYGGEIRQLALAKSAQRKRK